MVRGMQFDVLGALHERYCVRLYCKLYVLVLPYPSLDETLVM